MNIGSDVVALVAVLLIVLFMWIITANALAACGESRARFSRSGW